jgi:hypothetical protein
MPARRTVVNASAELGAVELAPAAAHRRYPASAPELHEPADQHCDDCDDEAAAQGLHGGSVGRDLRSASGRSAVCQVQHDEEDRYHFKELLVLKGKKFLFFRVLDVASPMDPDAARTALVEVAKKAVKRV